MFTFAVNPTIFRFCHTGSVLFVVSVCLSPGFVSTPSLWPKISFHHITRAGRGLSPLRLSQKLNSPTKWYFVQALWRAAFLSLGHPPSRPLIFWKVCIRPWIFLVNMIKSARVRSHMPMWIKWTELATPNFYPFFYLKSQNFKIKL